MLSAHIIYVGGEQMIICSRCEQEKEPHKHNRHLCEECVKAENNRVSYLRRQNLNWMELAKEAELELWERQPGETDHEYNVWLHYRDAYPGKKPTYRDVAEALKTSVNAVRKIGARWDFPVRLQAWAKHVDEITLEQRRTEIIEMNKKHIDMANRVAEKLSAAIDAIEPESLSPREITSLFKLSTDIERTARLDKVPESGVVLSDDNPELKEAEVQTSDISEILKILDQTGVMNNVGVRKTTTTEVVIKDD